MTASILLRDSECRPVGPSSELKRLGSNVSGELTPPSTSASKHHGCPPRNPTDRPKRAMSGMMVGLGSWIFWSSTCGVVASRALHDTEHRHSSGKPSFPRRAGGIAATGHIKHALMSLYSTCLMASINPLFRVGGCKWLQQPPTHLQFAHLERSGRIPFRFGEELSSRATMEM